MAISAKKKTDKRQIQRKMHANKYKTTGKRSGSDKGGCGCCKPELARLHFAGGPRPDGAGRAAVRVGPGAEKRGRRGTIGGYWGGYSSLSSSPTHKALPGKVENLTPPARRKVPPGKTVKQYPRRRSVERGQGRRSQQHTAQQAGQRHTRRALPASFFS